MSLLSAHGRIAVLLAALCTVPQPALANPDAPCYDPTGALVPGYYPCDPTAYITNCCASGWTCFSNSLCVVTTASESYPNLTMGAVERAMCTNPMWNNEICGDFCITGSDNSDGEMVACGDNRFCCLGDYNAGLCNCTTSVDGTADDEGDSFVVNDGRAQTIVGETDAFTGTVSYLVPPSTLSSTTTSTTSTTSTTATTAKMSLSGSSSITASSSGTAAAQSSTAASAAASTGTSIATGTGTATPTPQPSPPKKSNVVAIGVGVGVSVGALAIAGAGYWTYRSCTYRQPGFGRRRFSHRDLSTDLALDGTAVGEQMAMHHNGYDRGLGSRHGLHDDIQEVPPPPPQPRAGA